jgi:hypothetical protein
MPANMARSALENFVQNAASLALNSVVTPWLSRTVVLS